MASSCRKPSEYIATILDLSALVMRRAENPLLHMDFLYQLTPNGRRFHKACRLVHDFTDAVIQERHRTLPDQGLDDFLPAKAKSKTLDFIDVLLLTKVGFSRDRMDFEVKCQVTSLGLDAEGTVATWKVPKEEWDILVTDFTDDSGIQTARTVNSETMKSLRCHSIYKS
jgi:hypothetical protein